MYLKTRIHITHKMPRHAKKQKSLSKNQQSLVRKIANQVVRGRSERKHYQTTANSTQNNSATITSISNIPQGDTDETRDGDQLRISSVELNYELIGADATNLFRVMLFQWFDDSTPTVTDVLTSAIDAILQTYRRDTRRMFRVLYDHTHPLSLNSSNEVLVRFKRFTRGFRRKIQYQAGGTTGINKLYILLVSDSGVASDPAYIYKTRVNYTDM